MHRAGPESEPRSQIKLKDSQIFKGPDGITFTDFGSSLQKLFLNVRTLRSIENGQDSLEFKKILEIEIEESCLITGIPNSKDCIDNAAFQFQQIVDRRMSKFSLRNGHGKGWIKNIEKMLMIQKGNHE
ncbi:MAG: hypothetical protein QXO70_03960 [Candidatus Pacearchaeota archaeon]